MALTLETVSPRIAKSIAVSPAAPDHGRDLLQGTPAEAQRHHCSIAAYYGTAFFIDCIGSTPGPCRSTNGPSPHRPPIST
jgi:hypothetical protein